MAPDNRKQQQKSTPAKSCRFPSFFFFFNIAGLDPMGLFWSLKPSPAGAQNIRMVVRNGDEPALYTLSVYQGHFSLSDLVIAETAPEPVYRTTVTRLKKSADVRRIPVKEGSVRGTLFLPPGKSCVNGSVKG